MPKISEEKMELRRAKVRQGAFKVFSQKGFSVASMEDIVRATGVSKGGVYTYFSSKDAIFLSIAEERFLIRRKRIADMPKTLRADEKIELYMRKFLESLGTTEVNEGLKFTFEFWSLKCREPEIAELAVQRYRKFEEDLMALMTVGIAEGSLKADLDMKSAILILLGALDGMGFMSAVMGVKTSEETVEDFIRMVMAYLKG